MNLFLPAVGAWVCLLALPATVLAQGLAPAPQQAASPAEKLSAAAASLGIRRCLPAISRLSTLAIQGSRSHDVLVDWDRQQPDNGPMFGMIGIEFPNAGVVASITAIPEAGGTCTVAAERVSVAPFTCSSIAEQELPNHRMARLLPNYAVYIDDKEPTSSVSLIDSPPGCLVIRRYVEYRWKNPAAGGAAGTANPTAAPVRR